MAVLKPPIKDVSAGKAELSDINKDDWQGVTLTASTDKLPAVQVWSQGNVMTAVVYIDEQGNSRFSYKSPDNLVELTPMGSRIPPKSQRTAISTTSEGQPIMWLALSSMCSCSCMILIAAAFMILMKKGSSG